MSGYAVISSVGLRRPVDQLTSRLNELPLPVLFVDQQDASIVYLLGGCQSDGNN